MTEFSDVSSMSELSDMSHRGARQNYFYRQAEERPSAMMEINPKNISKDSLEKFRSIVKHQILESIICAFELFAEDIPPKHLYDKNLGLGEAPLDTHMVLETQQEKKERIKGLPYITKHIKEFFAFNK